MVRAVTLLVCALFGAACAPPCEDGSMLDSEGGMAVERAEHPEAWGRSDCAACHALQGLHRAGCAPVDLQAVREEVLDDGLASCARCHGAMGVPQ